VLQSEREKQRLDSVGSDRRYSETSDGSERGGSLLVSQSNLLHVHGVKLLLCNALDNICEIYVIQQVMKNVWVSDL